MRLNQAILSNDTFRRFGQKTPYSNEKIISINQKLEELRAILDS